MASVPLRITVQALWFLGLAASCAVPPAYADETCPLFLQPEAWAVGSGPYDLVAGDFNGDGHLDLATSDFAAGTVSILLNSGAGAFAGAVAYAVESGPCAITLFGSDLAVANRESNTVSVLRNNGDGTFAPQLPFPVGPAPCAIAAADLDGDGYLDLALANFGGNTVSVLLGTPDGSFHPHVTYPVGAQPRSVAVGDLNGDGHLDLAVANYGTSGGGDTVSVLLNLGDGTFATHVTWPTGIRPTRLVIGDLDQDGDLDLVTANEGAPGAQLGTVSVLRNTGEAAFAQALSYPTGLAAAAVTIGDLDGDGWLDLVAVNSGSEDVFVLRNEGAGLFVGYGTYPVGRVPTSAVLGDLDGDGVPEIVTTSYGTSHSPGNTIVVLPGHGDGTFRAPATYGVGRGPRAIAVTDIDGDGAPDLAVANFHAATVSLRWNDGTGRFPTHDKYVVGGGPAAVAVGDLDGDGNADLVLANYNDATVSVLLNDGYGLFFEHVTYSVGNGPRSIVLADVNGDGHPDIAVVNEYAVSVSVLHNHGDGTFAAALSYPVVGSPRTIAAADLDGDGRVDLAATNWSAASVSVLRNNGDGTFAAQTPYSAGNTPSGLAIGDLDGDGDADLVVANDYPDTVSVLRNNGDGTFAPRVTYAAGDAPIAVALGDLEGDGTTDLIVMSQFGQTVAFLAGNGDGTFAAQVAYEAGSNPRSAAIGDLDGDGRADLAVASWGAANIRIMLNQGLYVHVLSQPAAQTAVAGYAVAFDVAAAGSGPLSYQWRRYQGGQWVALADDERVSGANSDSLAINPVRSADSGLYDVWISNECGAAASLPAPLVVTVVPGDLDEDGDVDLDDYQLFRAAFGRCLGDPGFNPLGDYDGDECVTLADYRLWLEYFQQGGGDPHALPPTHVADMNCDGAVDFADIAPFVMALVDPATWAAAYPNCNISNGDANGNGVLGLDDVNSFVAILSGR